ncbi:MAG TPA: hypothetical protein PKI19_04605 [Elusimicrobiales bacterium]|nr:hypothetical protein [Elusimicrobiales bacterium]
MKIVKLFALLLIFGAGSGFAAESTGVVKGTGLNNITGAKGEKVSRALLLLPHDRGGAGVLSFWIEAGTQPGVYQCPALGRGATSLEPKPGWVRGMIGGTTIYYAPMEVKDGATVPGIYDLRNITPDRYEIVFLGKPGDVKDEPTLLARTADPDGKPKPFYSAVWRHWYSSVAPSVPVDMVWAEDSQAGTQGEGRPVLESRSKPATPEEQARQEAQLAHSPRYYYGPYGRSGWAMHTDRWDDAGRQADPKYAGRPELTDFRYRDTSGCVKLRAPCLLLLNEFVSEQEQLGRRVQLEVRELP